MVRTSVTHSAIASCATFLFLPHFDVIRDLLQDRCTATWNLPAARVFYISLVFSNARRVLSQCNTRLRLLYLSIKHGFLTNQSARRVLSIL